MDLYLLVVQIYIEKITFFVVCHAVFGYMVHFIIKQYEMSDHISLHRRLALEIHRLKANELVKEHPLRQLFWECTLRCNLHCKHCGSDCKKLSTCKDMPIVDFLKVIDSITPHVDPNKVFVIFTGGEPLMRDDLEVCGLELYNRGYPWGMVTNGLYLTRERLDSLQAAGLHTVSISLDGFAEDHNWMRGHPESFNRAVEAIRMMCQETELLFDVVTCMNKRSLLQLEEMKRFLINLGVKHWRLFTIFPVGRAAQHPELQLTNDEFVSVLEFIKHTRKEGKIHLSYGCEGFLGNYEGEVRDHFYECQAGISVASVLADGSISACPSIRSNLHQGTIYKEDFMTVWNSQFHPYRDREWMKKGACSTCSMFRYCRGNGMHLRDDEGNLLLCHYKRLQTK